MKIKILDRITDVAPGAWNRLQGPHAHPLIEHGYLAALELSGATARERYEPRHLTLWSGDTLIAGVPCYLKHSDRGDVLHDWAADVARKNELPYQPTLFIGVPFCWTGSPKLLIAPDVDRPSAVEQLMNAAKEVISTSGSPVIHLYLGTADEVALLEPLGFHSRLSPRYAWRNAGYTSFEAFLARLRSKRRSAVRMERRKVHEAGLRVRSVRGAEVTTEIMELMSRFHQNTIARHGPEFDFYSRDFFLLTRELLGDRVEIFLAEREGVPVAGSFNLASERELFVRTWGTVEDVPYLHFEVTWYHAMEEAIARGLAEVDPGGPGDHKLMRGFVPEGLHHSASWIGDEDLNEAFAHYMKKERAWLPRHLEELRGRSPMLEITEGAP